MVDKNKITKSVTFDPEMVEYVNQIAEENATDFSKEIVKSVNLRKASMEKEIYKYSDELEAIPLSSLRGRSSGFWMREAAIGINRLLEYMQEQSIREEK